LAVDVVKTDDDDISELELEVILVLDLELVLEVFGQVLPVQDVGTGVKI
jgi:hypothetical protein